MGAPFHLLSARGRAHTVQCTGNVPSQVLRLCDSPAWGGRRWGDCASLAVWGACGHPLSCSGAPCEAVSPSSPPPTSPAASSPTTLTARPPQVLPHPPSFLHPWHRLGDTRPRTALWCLPPDRRRRAPWPSSPLPVRPRRALRLPPFPPLMSPLRSVTWRATTMPPGRRCWA